MSPEPSVSVCIPCYNGDQFVGRTIESVLAQSFTNFELILVDDQSTDDTVSVLKSFSDPRIRLFLNEHNMGLGPSWKSALSQSTAKYVKLLCDDDLLHPDCLAKQVQLLEDPSHSEVVLAVCNRKVIDSNGRVILEKRLPFPCGRIDGATLVRKSIRWGANLVGEPAVGLFRRDALLRSTTWKATNSYYADLDLWTQLLVHGDAFLDPEFMASFRISPDAASSRFGFRQAAEFRSFARELRRNAQYRLSTLDFIRGYVLSFQWCLARNAFLKFHCWRGTSSHALKSQGQRPLASERSKTIAGIPDANPKLETHRFGKLVNHF
jgi:glycosyltransferase involved in cell wall biosynthesis